MILRHKMKKIFLLCFALSSSLYAQEMTPMITVGAMEEHVADLLFVLVAPFAQMREVAHIIKQDLEFTQQLSVTIVERSKAMWTKEITALADTYPFIIFFTGQESEGFTLDWRLYDAQQAVMLEGKRAIYKDGLLHDWAD